MSASGGNRQSAVLASFGKQHPPPWAPLRTRAGYVAALSVIEHEPAAAYGLMAYPADGRRRHIHYTHVRTKRATDVQPDQFTRKASWDHLALCYQEADPKAESDTGPILQFGIVCKEKHHDACRDVDRSQHHHAAVFCPEKQMWNRVRKISADKYIIQLNAVAHGAHATMCN